MNKIYLSLVLMMPFSLLANEISQYKYYQTDNYVPNGRKPYYAAFLISDSPCIFVKDFRENETKEYCQMGDSPLNLKRDYPSIYPSNFRLSAKTLYFIVAAPWNEQECEIFFPEKSITCESTGKN